MNRSFPLDACRAGRLPLHGLAALAPLRTKGGIRVRLGDPVWIEWEGDRPEIVAAILAVSGVEFFEPRDGRWHRAGSHLPAFDVPPQAESIPLDRAVFPAAFTAIPVSSDGPTRLPLRLVRCDTPHATSALRCPVAALASWADTAMTSEIRAARAARCGSTAWLVGSRLPPLADCERFWGERVWIPLGLRAEPDWPESTIREAAAVHAGEILVITPAATEAIPLDVFQPLSRSAIRRAV